MIAIIALIISFASFWVAYKAHKLTELQYTDQTTPTWIGEIDNEKKNMIIGVKNDNISFQEGIIYLPKELSGSHSKLKISRLEADLASLEKNISSYIKRKNGEGKIKNSNLGVGNGHIPIIIDSRYTFYGTLYSNRSIYGISYEFSLPKQNSYDSKVDITFKDLVFKGHIPDNAEIYESLSVLWKDFHSLEN